MNRRRGVRRQRRADRGYVLVFVLAALALVALVAERFQVRIDDLRKQTATLSDHARARVAAGNALAAGLYWLSTRPPGPAGYGPLGQPGLRADDRPYALDTGGQLRVQDLRGLYPLNMPERGSFARLLHGLGADDALDDSYLDILLDYEDTDNLKRLNGAEADDYARLGLPPPRNDWLLSVRELNRMPLWRDHPELVVAIEPLVSVSRAASVNPNTAPRQILQALLPQARAEQLDRFEVLRAQAPFPSGDVAHQTSGLALNRDDFVFFVSDQQRLTVWAPGMPQSLQYNVLLLPEGRTAPWLISEVHPAARPPEPSDAHERVTSFPLVIAPAAP